MGKRSEFARRYMDAYATPFAAVPPLIPYLRRDGIRSYIEPCCGDGDLVDHLNHFGLHCAYANDIRFGFDAMSLDADMMASLGAGGIVTNPPWTRELLHPMIEHFAKLGPTWLLFDADWAFTRQAAPLLPLCTHIVAIGRVKWLRDSPNTSKDNSAWYRFRAGHNGGTRFYGRDML